MGTFTFKTENPTGKWKAFDTPYHYIKLNKQEVGSIDHKLPHKIKLMVIKEDINSDKNPNCTWKWITIAKKSASIKEAKQFLNENIENILTKFNLYSEKNRNENKKI